MLLPYTTDQHSILTHPGVTAFPQQETHLSAQTLIGTMPASLLPGFSPYTKPGSLRANPDNHQPTAVSTQAAMSFLTIGCFLVLRPCPRLLALQQLDAGVVP